MQEQRERLLLVDDEEGIRKVLGITLEDMGYEVLLAENGEQALEVFHQQHPTIVLTDIKMPGMDGIDLLKALKKADPEIEVIMISGHGDMELAIQSLKYDAADFVTKPINDEILENSLMRVSERLSLKREIKRYTENLEDMVRIKSAQYRQLFNEVPCYISVQDKNLNIVDANRRFREDFGESLGRTCHLTYKGRSTPCQNCPAVKTFEDGVTRQYETVLTNSRGEQLNVLIVTAPLTDKSGEIVHVMEMVTDITEIRRLQDRLASIGMMIASMSHGVKGMLTALDGGMYRLESGIKRKDMDKIESGYGVVTEMVGRVREMVLDMLYYAKSRKLELTIEGVECFTRLVADTVAPKAAKNNVEFATTLGKDVGEFEVDTRAFSAALVNIMENGVDACSSESNSAACKEDYRVELHVEGDRDTVTFTISDNGTGMDTETREKMFTLFFSSKGTSGTGLGLFIASEVVKQHGGTIAVESEVGQGTSFIIRMPRVVPEEEAHGNGDGGNGNGAHGENGTELETVQA